MDDDTTQTWERLADEAKDWPEGDARRLHHIRRFLTQISPNGPRDDALTPWEEGILRSLSGLPSHP